MDLKKHEQFINLSDKLNLKDESDKKSNILSGKDRKFEFFWEKCMPEDIDVSSIIKKTQLKIKQDAIRRRRRYFMLSSASIAASFLIFVSVFYFLQQSKADKRLDTVAMIEKIDVKSVKNVTLITSGNRMILDGNVYVKYTKDGKMIVNSKGVDEQVCEGNEYNQLVVPAGRRACVELSDGTILTVNSQSKIIYPRCFSGNIRKIYADGEVFMDVAHDKAHPFIVTSGNFNLRVLGTKFNISTYKGMESIVLVKGSVEVTDRQSHKIKLSPNDLLSMENGTFTGQKKVDVSEYISWVDGALVLRDNCLSSVVRKLSIYYGIPIHCSESVADKKIYGKLDLKDNLDGVLKCIQQTIPMKIEKTDAGIFLK